MQFSKNAGASFFGERIGRSSIQVIEGETSDTLAHADVAIAASGTVTIEAAILGTPMVTFYKVTPLSWALGRFLVRVPFYSMVNLVAGKKNRPRAYAGSGIWRESGGGSHKITGRRREPEPNETGSGGSRIETGFPEHPMDRAARIVSEYLNGREK